MSSHSGGNDGNEDEPVFAIIWTCFSEGGHILIPAAIRYGGLIDCLGRLRSQYRVVFETAYLLEFGRTCS